MLCPPNRRLPEAFAASGNGHDVHHRLLHFNHQGTAEIRLAEWRPPRGEAAAFKQASAGAPPNTLRAKQESSHSSVAWCCACVTPGRLRCSSQRIASTSRYGPLHSERFDRRRQRQRRVRSRALRIVLATLVARLTFAAACTVTTITSSMLSYEAVTTELLQKPTIVTVTTMA